MQRLNGAAAICSGLRHYFAFFVNAMMLVEFMLSRIYVVVVNIGIACGGTGGHVFPGLATAGILRQRGHEVTLWLSGRDVRAE